ncbi:MAG: hypothetical protein COB60_06685 [Flavobacteriaceae bacterium]|nr:MAG: hypothetical protein COB60_06685 [Flavobacteriaceae bacterium]
MNEEQYIAFDAYLQGELKGEELQSFEHKLLNDAGFKTAFQDYADVEQSLKSSIEHASKEKELRATLNTLRNQEKPSENSSVFSIKRYVWMGVAASVLLLFSVYIFNDVDPPSYAEYAMHQPLEVGVRGTTNTSSNAAEEAFNSKDYQTAVHELRLLLGTSPENVEWQLYYGISLIETDRIATALTILEPITSGASVYKHTAQWYTALGYLKSEKLEWCKSALEKIPSEASEFEKAQELLDRL